MDNERDRNPLAPPALREDQASYSTPLKFLYLINVINALALTAPIGPFRCGARCPVYGFGV